MNDNKARKWVWAIREPQIAIYLLIVLAILVGCNAAGEENTTEGLYDPFSSHHDGGDGSNVTWSGYTRGYQPHSEVPVEITLRNNDMDDEWLGRFCLMIMDNASNELLSSFPMEDFALSYGTGFSKFYSLRLPEELGEGVYYLVLVVRKPGGPIVESVPIQVGAKILTVPPVDQHTIEAALALCK